MQLNFDRFGATDAHGAFSFEHVPLDGFLVQASDANNVAAATAIGRLNADGQIAAFDLRLPALNTVTGTVFQNDGVTPAANVDVTVQNFDSNGDLAPLFPPFLTTDANGHFQATNVPTGQILVSAFDPLHPAQPGRSDGTLAATPATINVTLGNAFTFFTPAFQPRTLSGTDLFRYDFDCDGEIDAGGTTDGRLSRAYDGAFILSLNGNSAGNAFGATYLCFIAVPNDPSGQGIEYSSVGYAGLRVSRKAFVPSTGGFARYLEVVSNPTSSAISAAVLVGSFLDSGTFTQIATVPSATANTYAVTKSSAGCCTPSLGFVFSGATPSVPVTSTTFVNGSGYVAYRWDVTVPAGGTVAFMHFAIQRDPADTAGVQSQAAALANLTDANALTGLSSTEQAEIVNFQVPIANLQAPEQFRVSDTLSSSAILLFTSSMLRQDAATECGLDLVCPAPNETLLWIRNGASAEGSAALLRSNPEAMLPEILMDKPQ
jgi:hypothetical protein